MNITVTYRIARGKECNVQIDQRQEIGAGFLVLQESGKMPCSVKPDFFHSDSLRKVVSAYCTFEELSIYSGDVLSVIENIYN